MNLKNRRYRFLEVLGFLCLWLNFGSPINAQKSINSDLNDAKKEAFQLNYPVAIDLFKGVLTIDSTNEKALEGLIDIYLYRYEIYDSAEVYLLKRMNSMLNTNELVFFDYANCLRLQERQYEAIDQYLYFKQNGMRLNKYAYLEPDVNNYLETCRYAIKNKGIVNDNNTYTVENMDFYINSVDSEYTPVFIEEDSLLLFNARYKDFETEEITEWNKYYENIYYFDLVESVSSSYNPGIEQENHHAVIGKKEDNDDILIFYKLKKCLYNLFNYQNFFHGLTMLIVYFILKPKVFFKVMYFLVNRQLYFIERIN